MLGLGIGEIGRKQHGGAWRRREIDHIYEEKKLRGGAGAGCVAGVGGNFGGGGWRPHAEEMVRFMPQIYTNRGKLLGPKKFGHGIKIGHLLELCFYPSLR
jgi:hypothetical protein